ncbi:methyltransferase [Streptomyces sp. NPDC051016]|uniref:methyltransferase n=1 Tax=Streptomyces sp. NPDC051016 TaxID=3365638 RepID=UPI0037B996DB
MKTEPTTAQELVGIVTGGWRAQAVHAAAVFRLPDHVEAGLATDPALAAASGVPEQGIRRLMRLLVAMRVFEEDPALGYRSTELSRALLDRAGTLRDMCLLYGAEFYTAWGRAADCLRTLTAGFELVHGEPLYPYLDGHPDLADLFQRTMRAGNLFFDRVPEVFDFSGGKTVVDCGGGNGHLLSVLLGAAPDARGKLVDRDHVIPLARAHLAGTVGPDRVELFGGDMFRAVPEGGDVYVFCRVLAGWSDDDAVTAFTHCRRAMAGPASRLLILDRVVADRGSTVLPALWDLHLLMTTGGGHRSLDRLRSLLDRAGWHLERTAELPMEHTALIAAPRTGTDTGR